MQTQGAHKDALNLIAAQYDTFGKRRNIAFAQGELEPLRNRQQQVLRLLMGLRRKQRDVHIEPSLSL